MSSSQENEFNKIMLQVGYTGRFQKIYNILFNFCFITVCTLVYVGIFISLAIPDHWCKISDNGYLNLTNEERSNLSQQWKNNESKFSQCNMYNDAGEVTECVNGWRYDRTYYGQTISTQENWVCQRELYVANFLFFGRIGDIIGTIFVQFGDVYGRRPLLYAAIVILTIGRLGLLISKGSFWLFAMFFTMQCLSSLAVYQAPLVIAMEMSNDEARTRISFTQSLAYATAMCGGPLLFWIFNDWVTFTLITTLPLILFLFMRPIMIESPRWLISKGHITQSLKELKKIANWNQSNFSEEAFLNLSTSSENSKTNNNYSFITLFTRWNLAKKTILVITEWICYMTVYSLLFLNITNLKGNPFLNYFWQAFAELPGYFLGKYLSDKFGRKFTIFVGFTGASIISLVLVYVLTDDQNIVTTSICGVLIKFTISIIYLTLNLQTLEIYPTCLRQTGSSLGFLISSIFGVATPYIIYLGATRNLGFPYMVSACLCILGAVVSIFLPETYNKKLPETISEADEFGKDQALMNLFHFKKESHKSVPNNEI